MTEGRERPASVLSRFERQGLRNFGLKFTCHLDRRGCGVFNEVDGVIHQFRGSLHRRELPYTFGFFPKPRGVLRGAIKKRTRFERLVGSFGRRFRCLRKDRLELRISHWRESSNSVERLLKNRHAVDARDDH